MSEANYFPTAVTYNSGVNPVDSLGRYLRRLRLRFFWLACARGGAIAAGAALLLTVAFAAHTLTPASLRGARLVLFPILLALVLFALGAPLRRLNRRAVAGMAERAEPRFEERLVTFVERRIGPLSEPFLPFLAADTMEIARTAPPQHFVKSGTIIGFTAICLLSAAPLAWLLFAATGGVGSNAQAIWAMRSLFRIDVDPGHKIVGRGSDLAVLAHLNGFIAPVAELRVRFGSSAKWQRLPMWATADGGFGFRLTGVAADAEFYVEAEGVRSPIAHVQAVDLPHVTGITADYPDGSAEIGGDLLAPRGTVVRLEIKMDRPMSGGELVFEAGGQIPLPNTQADRTGARVTIANDGAYHVGLVYHGEPVQVSEDYGITVLREMPTDKKGPPRPLPDGVRSDSGRIPPGYENAVRDYFQRLNGQKAGR